MLDALLALDWLCFTPTCWKRAAVLNRFLALQGIEARIVFGVRREEAGQPLLEKSTPDYIVTFSYPST